LDRTNWNILREGRRKKGGHRSLSQLPTFSRNNETRKGRKEGKKCFLLVTRKRRTKAGKGSIKKVRGIERTRFQGKEEEKIKEEELENLPPKHNRKTRFGSLKAAT